MDLKTPSSTRDDATTPVAEGPTLFTTSPLVTEEGDSATIFDIPHTPTTTSLNDLRKRVTENPLHGVSIVRSRADALDYLGATTEPLVAQEFVPGVEFGIFYYRIPGQARGRIFAITDKRFPEVVGDGGSTLERLILRDDRAVSMAPFFLAKHAARLDEVPGAGQRIQLVELGTHSRGSAFFDGEWVRTPELEAAIDQLSQGYQGFWFGRYDIKAHSAEALQQGRDFKVLELNGATAEATSIYDPKNGLFDAYRTLRTQWSILFEIAAKNVAAGTKPATVGELFRLIDVHRRSLGAHVST